MNKVPTQWYLKFCFSTISNYQSAKKEIKKKESLYIQMTSWFRKMKLQFHQNSFKISSKLTSQIVNVKTIIVVILPLSPEHNPEF